MFWCYFQNDFSWILNSRLLILCEINAEKLLRDVLILTSHEWIEGRCCGIYFPPEKSIFEIKLWFFLRLPIVWLFSYGTVCFLWFKNIFNSSFHFANMSLCDWPVDSGLKSYMANSLCLLYPLLGGDQQLTRNPVFCASHCGSKLILGLIAFLLS